jgi:phage shock protein A
MTDGDDAARVDELAATVDGLTAELLDLQERVSELEAQLEGEPPESESKTVEELFAQADGGTESDASDLEDVETIGDDILVG